jgi:hypothetical protein
MIMMNDCFVPSREQVDAQVAKQLAENIEREELEKRQALEEGDQEIARKLQVSMVLTTTHMAWRDVNRVNDTVFKDVMRNFVERCQ